MTSSRDQMIKLLKEQPEDSTYDGILKELALSRMIERGLNDSNAKRRIPDEEMDRRINSW